MEIKHIYLASEITVKQFGTDFQLKFSVDLNTCTALCMGFFLLKEGLSNSLSVQFGNYLLILKLAQGKYSSFDSLNSIQKVFKGKIAINELEYLLYYLLKIYRDGFAEIEHIDISFASDNAEVVLTVSCEDYSAVL
ncbi:hypothetical protein BWD42_21670 [Sphingobacterium sp. CZ-UAM]|uniref:hypothetical protein n=1 Tax=Sphingobacterium sp. CZ-UAM TaxID=1933868 RepID=UPI000987299E|nr:hypothetical protein [Sphingobacterium sp. CZ-UAM]OOG16347.1 hypothetical protein BWD42_21670 [Sphingobacterium sp. CZ-UAM]